MKILTVTEFDPAGVHLRHRAALRDLGVDYRLAVHAVYRPEGSKADWILDGKDRKAPDFDGLRDFAEEADLVQFCPAIGQPWSFTHTDFVAEDADLVPFGPIDWTSLRLRTRVAVFHGSLNAEKNAERYAVHYRSRGFQLAATTLDYAHRMEAHYLPSVVDVREYERAGLRQEGEALRVIHSPTDRRVCSTAEFLQAAAGIGIEPTVAMNRPHPQLMAEKARHHVGFDHLRGAFSVNSLENAALGLVSLVGVKPAYRARLEEHGVALPWPHVETIDDARDTLRELKHDTAQTRYWQERARTWGATEWSPAVVGQRLAKTYRGMA